MKALIINDQIQLRFQEVPKFLKQFRNVQRPDLLNEQELAERNIHIVEIDEPEFDFEVEELQNERFELELNKVIFDVVDLEIDIETERAKKIKEFETIVEGEMMDALKIGVLEKLVLGEAVPQETKNKVIALRERETVVITLINQITDPKALRKFKFDRTEIDADKAILKSARKI
jgi:hypothetical protein